MNVLNNTHDYAGAVHFESHPTKFLQTDLYDHYGLVLNT